MRWIHIEELKYFFPLVVGWIGVGIGWILQEVSHSLSDRRERKQAISSALTDLLEIRFHLRIVELALEKVSALVSLPEQGRAQIWVVFQQMVPNSADLHKRYNDSVSVVASLDPRLGFSLRSKDLIRPLLTLLNTIAAQDPKAATLWIAVQKPLADHANTRFDEVILDVARAHSYRTYRWAKKELVQMLETPKEAQEWLELVSNEIKRQALAASQPTSTTTGTEQAAPQQEAGRVG